jgi:hypothetical protein
MEQAKKAKRWRLAAVLATGIAIGVVIMATPAASHIGSVRHLWNHHIKPRADKRYDRPTIKWGETVRGTVGEQVRVSNTGEVGFNGQLPRQAPVGLDDDHVIIDGVDEPGTQCSGDSVHPSAAPGYLCMYPYSVSNMTANEGAIWGGGDGTRWGFQVSLDATSTTIAYWFANWAYHAPNNPPATPRPVARAGNGCATNGSAGC